MGQTQTGRGGPENVPRTWAVGNHQTPRERCGVCCSSWAWAEVEPEILDKGEGGCAKARDPDTERQCQREQQADQEEGGKSLSLTHSRLHSSAENQSEQMSREKPRARFRSLTLRETHLIHNHRHRLFHTPGLPKGSAIRASLT